jgi:fructokinase
MTIGVIGESLVDVVTDASGVTAERPGGSPLNVALTLARLDHDVRLFTAVGNDDRGGTLLAHLSDEGIAVTRGSSAAATSVARAVVDADGTATYDFDLEWNPQFADDWPELKVLHFGSIGSLAAPGAAEVAAIVDRYRGQSLISYDPNWRDGFSTGAPRAVVEANAARADVVKLSDDDAAVLYPGVELDEVARTLLGLGPVLVVITKAAEGASAWTKENVKHCPAAVVDVVDTVGAGDAFMATMLSELAELSRETIAGFNRRELELVISFASFVAGRTCERVGADPPRLADLF